MTRLARRKAASSTHHRAEVGRARCPQRAVADQGQNLGILVGSRVPRDRPNGRAVAPRPPLQPEELGNPERTPARTQQRIVASCETSPKKSKGTIRRLRYVGKSHVACLLIMFLQGRLAMPHMRHENVRHATLLFRAEGVNVLTTSAEERSKRDSKKSARRKAVCGKSAYAIGRGGICIGGTG